MVVGLTTCYWLSILVLFVVESTGWKIALMILYSVVFLAACCREDELLKRVEKLEEKHRDL